MSGSTTSCACPRCGRLDFPHVCLPWIGLEPIVAEREQGVVRFDVTIALDALAAVGGEEAAT